MAKRLNFWLHQVVWSALDWWFSPSCRGCGKLGARWCARCQKNSPSYSALRSYAVFAGGARNALQHLKYWRIISLGELLARTVVDSVRSEQWIIDPIIPIPLGLARLAERGYNQSSLLARPHSLALYVPYRPQSRVRVKGNTRSQVELTTVARRSNVSGTFAAHFARGKGKRALTVDVTTTASTLEACAEACFTAGTWQVYGLTLARAVFKSPPLSDYQQVLES